jgi:transposase-like protein
MAGGNRRKMKWIRYTIDQREWAIQQMMPPLNRAIVELAKTTGITTVTLRTWQKIARAEGGIVPGDGKRSDQWSSADKFRIVLETAPLSQVELSAYCRTKGVYPEQVAQWRVLCEQANVPVTAKAAGIPKADAKQAQRIRELERTLKEKDAALAEAGALLILEKKAEAIWGKGKAE